MQRFGFGTLSTEVATNMRLAAMRRMYHGMNDPRDKQTLLNCTAVHIPSGTTLIYTKEEGYHSSGWWKNPDYERCWHLSLSFCNPKTGEPIPKDKRLTNMWLDAFFGGNKQLLWVEPPAFKEGRERDVWHYRLFCDEHWRPFVPRGEVYNTEFTERGWKSFSELQAELKNNG